jgi:hypothetical protein
MVPLFVYISVLDSYLAKNYPSVYNNTGVFTTTSVVSKKVPQISDGLLRLVIID